MLAERGHRSACEQRAHYEAELAKLHNQLRQKDTEYEALKTEKRSAEEAFQKEVAERAKVKQDAAAQAAQHGLAMRKLQESMAEQDAAWQAKVEALEEQLEGEVESRRRASEESLEAQRALQSEIQRLACEKAVRELKLQDEKAAIEKEWKADSMRVKQKDDELQRSREEAAEQVGIPLDTGGLPPSHELPDAPRVLQLTHPSIPPPAGNAP